MARYGALSGPGEERSEAIRLGRYGIRCPLVLERLHWDETSGEVIYRARPGRRDTRSESMARWDVLQLLARVLDHLPEPGEVTDPHDAEGRQRRLIWSQLIRKVHEIDPLLCPDCGSQLPLVAFLIDFASLRRLLAHLGFAPQQPESLAHSPPDETAFFVSDA